MDHCPGIIIQFMCLRWEKREHNNEDICGAIRQNETEAAQIKFVVFYIVVLGIFNATFGRKHLDENWLVTFRDLQAVESLAKQQKAKDIFQCQLAISKSVL